MDIETKNRIIEAMKNTIGAQNDKLMALRDILENISDEHCTPIVKKKIETMLSIIKA